jgi:6-phospho-beta-glucosidase
MAQKIAIIGGGSAYAPGIINAFIHQPEIFAGAEIALMDINAEALAIVHELSCRMVQAEGVDLKVTASQNQQEAVAGSNYVLSTFRQGGFEARHLDESIPLAFNVIGQETIGPGGFFFAMRTLPVIKSLINDIHAHAPGAMLINYTNPTQIVAEAVTHFSDVPCISICDQTKADQENIRKALNLPDAEILLESIGLNHATWSTYFTIAGEDGVKVMNRQIDSILKRDDVEERLKRQFLLTKEYGRLPNSYLQYYYFREETLREAKGSRKTRAEVIMQDLPGYYAHFKEQASAQHPDLKYVRGGSIFGDMAVEVLSGLIQNEHSIHTLNLPNANALPDFSPTRVVEVPACIARSYATPLVQESLPSELVGLLHMLAEYQWLAAKSIWSGNRKELEHALAANPLVLSLSLAKALLNAALPQLKPYFHEKTNAEWLG